MRAASDTRRRSVRVGLCLQGLVVVALALAVGCKGSSSSTPPGTPPTPTVTKVTVTGTASGAAGATSQLAATATFTDASTQVVTTQASWDSSNSAVASVNASGLVTFKAAGEADIRATYQTITGTLHVSTTGVTPPPVSKHRIFGVILETTTGKIVVGAVIQIVDGPDAGKSTQTDVGGAYVLDQVTDGSFSVRVSHSGYDTLTRSVTLSGDLQLDMAIKPQLDVSANFGTFNVGLSVLQQNCEFPPVPANTGTIVLSGQPDGTSFRFVITERGTSRTYNGNMQADGSFQANGSGVFAGIAAWALQQPQHDFSGSVSGSVTGTRTISGTENVTFGDPCPGKTLRLSFSGSK